MSTPTTDSPAEEVIVPEEENFDQTDFMDNSNFALKNEAVLPPEPQGQISLVTKYFRVTGMILGVVLLIVVILSLLLGRSSPPRENVVLSPIEQSRRAAEEKVQLVDDLANQMFIPSNSTMLEGLVDL
ncbi:hypothetical protein FWH30_02870 [Microgenomates group bacterium]|nr:hypothetical protein [Microgenomates group bacterium]